MIVDQFTIYILIDLNHLQYKVKIQNFASKIHYMGQVVFAEHKWSLLIQIQ